MDPLAGIIGACVIASWSYGLIRDTGAILLDRIPDSRLANEVRKLIESDGSTLPIYICGASDPVIWARSCRCARKKAAPPIIIERNWHATARSLT